MNNALDLLLFNLEENPSNTFLSQHTRTYSHTTVLSCCGTLTLDTSKLSNLHKKKNRRIKNHMYNINTCLSLNCASAEQRLLLGLRMQFAPSNKWET